MSLSRRQVSPITEKTQLATLAGFASRLGAFDARSAGVTGENEDNEELGVAFVDAATRAGWIVPFDWATWAQSAEGQRLSGDPRHIATATPDQLAKVLTVLIRGERFSEGTLSDAFENGLLLAITRRAEALLEQP
jgi:Family of unknown function (DUF6508)